MRYRKAQRNKTLGKIIRKYREKSGVSASQFALTIERNGEYFRQIERGEKYPGFDTLVEIAHELKEKFWKEIYDEIISKEIRIL